MRRESDDGYVCAACGETVIDDQCLCESEPLSEEDWSDLDDEARAVYEVYAEEIRRESEIAAAENLEEK